MRPALRWPLHPAPVEGEALSSWLRRVAACYQMEVRDLLAHDLGHGQVDDLDTAPPLSLLTVLSQRSGIALDRLRCMSVAGWVPWLLDSLDDQIPAALETYAFQFSVLLPRHNRKIRTVARWRAWLPSQPVDRACPLCLNDPADQAILLAWKLPLMLSCPLHGCWLESYWGVPGRLLRWENTDPLPRAASEAMTAGSINMFTDGSLLGSGDAGAAYVIVDGDTGIWREAEVAPLSECDHPYETELAALQQATQRAV